MMQTKLSVEKEFLDYVKKMVHINEAIGLMYWDLRTGAPKKGVEQRSEVIGTLSADVFAMSTSEEMKAFIEELSKSEVQDSLSDVTKKTLEEVKKDFERNAKIPPAEFKEYVILQSKAENVWEEAKGKSDFSLFQPYLEKLVAFNKKFIGYWGYEGNKYNTLLDMYEPGVTVEILDETFSKLRDRIVPLLQKVKEAGQPETSFLFDHFPKEKQKEFSLHVLKDMGYDFDSGD